MPSLHWSNANGARSISIADVKTQTSQVNFDIEVKNLIDVNGDSSFQLDTNINDSRLLVKMHDDLLKISGQEFLDTDTNNIATYILNTSLVQNNAVFSNQRQTSFTIFTNGVVTSDDFSRYSAIGNPNIIKTKIQIIGQSSGASLVIPVNINRVSS